MAGSPAQEAAAHQSRKRRASQITPDKSKKSTVSMSPASAETNSNKPARMAPVNPKGSTKSATLVTDKLPTTIDKAEGSGDGSVNPKSAKSDLAGKAKNKSEKVTAKNNKTDEKEKPAAKKDDNKDKGKEKAVDKAVEKAMEKAKETKVDAKDKATKATETPKPDQGVKLPDLVKPVPSDSADSSDEDSNDSDAIDTDDSCDSCGSDSSSDTSDSDNNSHTHDYLEDDLYNALDINSAEIYAMSPERRAEEKAKTLRNVQAFVDNTKDKHYHNFHLDPLTGRDNYASWLVGMEVLLRMHQVWCIVADVTVPLDRGHEMYPWYEHMLTVAISLVYANVSKEVRSDRCFMSSTVHRNPNNMMQHLWAHFGQQHEGDSD